MIRGQLHRNQMHSGGGSPFIEKKFVSQTRMSNSTPVKNGLIPGLFTGSGTRLINFFAVMRGYLYMTVVLYILEALAPNN